MIDDPTLLRSYVAEGDANAFAEIVRRHLSFVYAAALRRLGGDTHRARDVTQIVFCALARDAGRVARQPVLGGWLHTATRNAVINLVRSEKRRRTREEEASYMQRIDSGDSADWSRLRPVLDSALDQLGAQDREAVLARFFQGRSFGEIGASLGLSEEAARKRVDRAVDRLRTLLRPHGIASTSTALSLLLANQPASAAPAGLLSAVTSAALSTGGAAALGAATFFTMTKLQAGLVVTLLLAGAVALFTQQYTISTLREKAAAAPEHVARSESVGTPAGKKRAHTQSAARVHPGASDEADSPPPAATSGEMLAAISAALKHGKVPERYFAFMQALQMLSKDNWRGVLESFQEERKRTGLGHPEVGSIFVRRAGELAGAEVIDHFLTRGHAADASEAMIGWASKSPEEALRWLSLDANAEKRRSLMNAAIRGLALVEPDLAVKTLEAQPLGESGKYGTEFVTSMLRSASMDDAKHLVEGMVDRAAQAGHLKAGYLKNVFGDYAQLRLSQATANGAVADAAHWLTPYVTQPYLERWIVKETATRLTQQNPQTSLEWLADVNATLLRAGDQNTLEYRAALQAWKTKEGDPSVESWLYARSSHPHYDQMAAQYTRLVLEQEPNKALSWAGTIHDPALKQELLQAINQRMAARKS